MIVHRCIRQKCSCPVCFCIHKLIIFFSQIDHFVPRGVLNDQHRWGVGPAGGRGERGVGGAAARAGRQHPGPNPPEAPPLHPAANSNVSLLLPCCCSCTPTRTVPCARQPYSRQNCGCRRRACIACLPAFLCFCALSQLVDLPYTQTSGPSTSCPRSLSFSRCVCSSECSLALLLCPSCLPIYAAQRCCSALTDEALASSFFQAEASDDSGERRRRPSTALRKTTKVVPRFALPSPSSISRQSPVVVFPLLPFLMLSQHFRFCWSRPHPASSLSLPYSSWSQ